MPSPPIVIADGLRVGPGERLLIIAGPDVVESREHCLRMARALAEMTASRDVSFVFKCSVDKANRSSVDAYRGPGIEAGLSILADVKRETGVAVTSDFHEPAQAASFAEVVDLLQVPAFLCRQTDLLLAGARTGRPLNVKKGQFLAPEDAAGILGKVRSVEGAQVMLTERGTTFGYRNLVVDFRSLRRMRGLGVPVCFDATHSVQLPGAGGDRSGGERQFIADLARAAVAVGVDAVFFEVHDDPDRALCDGPNQLPLDEFPTLLDTLLALREAGAP